MADRRMFQKAILLSDKFFDLSKGARALYVTLGMSADDDGFCVDVKSRMRQSGGTAKELAELVSAGFLIPFPSGIHVIVHWHRHNAIRKDRHTPTVCTAELAQLVFTRERCYAARQPGDPQTATVGQPSDTPGKDSTEQPSTEQLSTEQVSYRGTLPVAANSDTSREKKVYGAFGNVLLTDGEYSALAERFPDLPMRIERFSRTLEKYGYRYKSHALALEDFCMEDREARRAEPKHTAGTPGMCASTFDTDSFFAAALEHSYNALQGTPSGDGS